MALISKDELKISTVSFHLALAKVRPPLLLFFLKIFVAFNSISAQTSIVVPSQIPLQGDPNQNLKFVLAITLKICISDPMLVKPKCVWEVKSFLFFSCLFTIFQKNFHLPNTFWLQQHMVRNAYFEIYRQKKFQILIRVSMYYDSGRNQKIHIIKRDRTKSFRISVGMRIDTAIFPNQFS